MISQSKRIVIVGGGILGLSIARNFLLKGFKNLTLLEKEECVANHQSSRNSGVMHAGLYYDPKSLKANLSRKGIVMMKKKIMTISKINKITRKNKQKKKRINKRKCL